MLTDWKLTDQLANISNQDLAMQFFCKVQFVIQHLILAKMCYCTISLFSQIYPCQTTSNILKLSRKQSAEEHTVESKNCKQIQYKQQLGLKQVYKSVNKQQKRYRMEPRRLRDIFSQCSHPKFLRIRQNQQDFSKNGTPTLLYSMAHGFPFLYNPSCSFIFM